MPTIDVISSFADPFQQDQGASKLVNCRVIMRQQTEQKLAQTRLVGSPGLSTICHPDTSPCIVLCQALGTVWSGHANGNIYSGVESGVPQYKGTVTVSYIYPVIRMAEDRTALVIASHQAGSPGGIGYLATITGGVVDAGLVSGIDFDPTTVCVLDNYTVWAGASNLYANQSDKMYSSAPVDPANVNANSYATAEARADAILDVVTLDRSFWAFGTRSVEVWYDQGGSSDFAFTPFTNVFFEVGLATRRTLAHIHSTVMWLATDRRIWLGQGQSAKPISPPWVDLLLQQIYPLELFTAYMYAQGGDEFYVLTHEGSWTIELALSTATWVYRKSYGRPDHAGRCALEHETGICYVGLDTGEICNLNLSTPNEPAGPLERSITTMWVGIQEKRHVIDQVDITSYMGVSAGTFSLEWSEDRALTWRGHRDIAWPAPGTRRAIARAMGTSRRRQLRLTYTGPVVPFQIDEFFVKVSQEAA